MQWYKQTDNMFYDTDNYRYWQKRDQKVRDREEKLRQPLKGENPVRPYRPDPRNQRPRPMGPGDYGKGPVIDNDTGKRVPPPQSPFRRAQDVAKRNLGNPKLGRFLRPLMRNMSPLDKLEFLEWLYKEWEKNAGKYPLPIPNPAAGWRRGGRCSTYRPNGWQLTTSNSTGQSHPWNNNANTCLYGQAAGAEVPMGTPVPGSDNQLNYVQKYGNLPYQYLAHTDAFWRPVGSPAGRPDFVRAWTLGRDPNYERWKNKLVQHHEPGEPFGEPSPQSGIGSPQTDPTPFYSDSSPYEPDHHWRWRAGLGTGSAATPGTSVPTPGATRAPPKVYESEGKVNTRSGRLGIMLYRTLDHVSEWAEVVEAIYDALPDDVKKRWERDRYMGDNFGQYGIGAAPWQLQALYYNWHKVDFVQAVKNVLKNQLSDAAIGGMQSKLPKNTGAAHEQGEKEFAKWLDDIFNEVLNS